MGWSVALQRACVLPLCLVRCYKLLNHCWLTISNSTDFSLSRERAVVLLWKMASRESRAIQLIIDASVNRALSTVIQVSNVIRHPLIIFPWGRVAVIPTGVTCLAGQWRPVNHRPPSPVTLPPRNSWTSNRRLVDRCWAVNTEYGRSGALTDMAYREHTGPLITLTVHTEHGLP